MSSRPVRLVCFDLGGVVVRICRSWEEGCAAAGVDQRLPPAAVRSIAPEAGQRAALVHLLDTGAVEPAAFYEGVAGLMGGLYTAAEIRRIHHAWILGEYDGVADVIDRVNALPGVETACLSNTNHDHWIQMAGLPFMTRLAHRHASHLLRLRKPDAACFEAFERAVGRAGDEILFFDDLPENVDAARDRGWRVERIDHEGHTAAQITDHLASHGVRI